MSPYEPRAWVDNSPPMKPYVVYLNRLEQRVLELEQALRFYADAQNYEYQYDATLGSTVSNVHYDEGEIARKALCRDE